MAGYARWVRLTVRVLGDKTPCLNRQALLAKNRTLEEGANYRTLEEVANYRTLEEVANYRTLAEEAI
jgi:hypothetical protein